jgi:hypothetical protein
MYLGLTYRTLFGSQPKPLSGLGVSPVLAVFSPTLALLAAQKNRGVQGLGQEEAPSTEAPPSTLPPPSLKPLAMPKAEEITALGVIGTLVGTASMAASAYHGYKRNNSVGWAIWWGFMGGVFPVITPVIAFAQGFGKPIKSPAAALAGWRKRKRRR